MDHPESNNVFGTAITAAVLIFIILSGLLLLTLGVCIFVYAWSRCHKKKYQQEKFVQLDESSNSVNDKTPLRRKPTVGSHQQFSDFPYSIHDIDARGPPVNFGTAQYLKDNSFSKSRTISPATSLQPFLFGSRT